MENIYIVKNVVGQYDEQTERSLCAVTTEQKAATLVKQFVELNKFNCEFYQRVRDEFNRDWQVNHPRPEPPMKPKVPEGFHDLQRLISEKSYSDKTQDISHLKKLFKELQDLHHSNLNVFSKEEQAYNKVYSSYIENFLLSEKEWIDKNYTAPSHLKEAADIVDKENHPFDSDNKYSYYKLGVIY